MRASPTSLAAVGLVAVAALGGPAAPSPSESGGDPDTAVRVVTTFSDPSIDESSGLVVRAPRLYTVNDSGAGPEVHVVDLRSGDTVSISSYDEEDPEDVEALAPGRGQSLWVGDIGDNRRSRETIVVHRLVPGPGQVDAQRYELAYPDGAQDAETLLVHPRTGRVYVVTKAPLLGGTVYEAPADLDARAVNRLARVAKVPGLVTDGAFFPDGRHLLLRTYGSAAVYTFPGFAPLGEFDLPEQEQGEAVSIGEDGSVFLSSEGAYSDVLEVGLPEALQTAMLRGETTAAPSPSASPPQPSPAPESQNPASEVRSPDEGGGVWVAAVVLVLAVAGWLFFTVSRPRSRRKP